MQPEQIKTLIESSLPCKEVQVGIDGSHVSLLVISEAFSGLSPVKKQQLVYAALTESIANGSIHAVHIKAFTPEEWQQQQ